MWGEPGPPGSDPDLAGKNLRQQRPGQLLVAFLAAHVDRVLHHRGIEAVGDINQNNGATMWGGLIAHQLYNLSANDNWVTFTTATAGQPGQSTYVEGLGLVPGSFSG